MVLKFATARCISVGTNNLSIHSLKGNPLKNEGAHIVSKALKNMKNLQHLK